MSHPLADRLLVSRTGDAYTVRDDGSLRRVIVVRELGDGRAVHRPAPKPPKAARKAAKRAQAQARGTFQRRLRSLLNAHG